MMRRRLGCSTLLVLLLGRAASGLHLGRGRPRSSAPTLKSSADCSGQKPRLVLTVSRRGEGSSSNPPDASGSSPKPSGPSGGRGSVFLSSAEVAFSSRRQAPFPYYKPQDLFCYKQTGGTCHHLPCKSGYGNTTCSQEGFCECLGEFCADGRGRCLSKESAERLPTLHTIGNNGQRIYVRKFGGIGINSDVDDSSRWRFIRNIDGSCLIQNVEWEDEFLTLASACGEANTPTHPEETSTSAPVWSPRDASWELYRARGDATQVFLKHVYWDRFLDLQEIAWGVSDGVRSTEQPVLEALWRVEPLVPDTLIKGELGLTTDGAAVQL